MNTKNKLFAILLIFVILMVLVSCGKSSALQAETTEVPETIIEYVEVEDTARIAELEAKLEQYKDLISNLNSLLSNVYYVTGENNEYGVYGTGFSLAYENDYYLITAGHIVDSVWGVFRNLGFQANFSDVWIYPELLAYENDSYYNRDYAIFYSDRIISGLKFNKELSNTTFILGNDYKNFNLIRNSFGTSIDGECGSPVINLNKEVIGVFNGASTDIDIVLEAIDNLE
jgi:hypothetical protein